MSRHRRGRMSRENRKNVNVLNFRLKEKVAALFRWIAMCSFSHGCRNTLRIPSSQLPELKTRLVQACPRMRCHWTSNISFSPRISQNWGRLTFCNSCALGSRRSGEVKLEDGITACMAGYWQVSQIFGTTQNVNLTRRRLQGMEGGNDS